MCLLSNGPNGLWHEAVTIDDSEFEIFKATCFQKIESAMSAHLRCLPELHVAELIVNIEAARFEIADS